MNKRLLLTTLCLSIFLSTPAFAAQYKLSEEHTSVNFKVKHIFSWVRGNFNDFSGTFVYKPGNPEAWSAEANIKTASIDTNDEARDKHLRSADFFDVEQYPQMTFKSTKVTDASDNSAKLHGILSLHGVEREVVLDLEILGTATDPWGNELAAFSATTTLNRKDYGINWNKVLDSGGVLVGEEVKVMIEVEGVKAE